MTPNELEAEELVGHEFSDASDFPDALREIAELGAHEAILTMPTGCIGLVGTDGERRLYRAQIETGVVENVSAVGAGDAFLAGYVSSRYAGRAPDECLRFAVACGADSVQHFGAGVIDPQEVGRLLEEVKIETLAEPAVTSHG